MIVTVIPVMVKGLRQVESDIQLQRNLVPKTRAQRLSVSGLGNTRAECPTMCFSRRIGDGAL